MVAQNMVDQDDEYDSISDELIDIIVSDNATSAEKNKATRDLYLRHFQWVNGVINRRVVGRADREDVAQIAWNIILDEKKFREYDKRGKFRAYLRAPITWAIQKHFGKKPFNRDDQGEKTNIQEIDLTDSLPDSSMDMSIIRMIIEDCIKPGLKTLDIRLRNSYMLNEHNMIFETDPNVTEAAAINDITTTLAQQLLDDAKAKSPADCSDDEQSIIIPVEYSHFIDQELTKPSQQYLAGSIGLTSAVYRTRVSIAKKEIKSLVQDNLPRILGYSA